MSGYYKNEPANVEVKRPGGFITTGDIGSMDQDGNLTLVGRTKDIIIHSGFNVYPVEIEAVLSQGLTAGIDDAGEIARATDRALQHLNDFLGHRPVAVLETGQQMQPYPHERFRPVPLFIKSAGVAAGQYHDLVESALEILGEMPVEILDGKKP